MEVNIFKAESGTQLVKRLLNLSSDFAGMA